MKTLDNLLDSLQCNLRIDYADFFLIDQPTDRFTIHLSEINCVNHLNVSVKAIRVNELIKVYPGSLISINNFGVDILHVYNLINGLYRFAPKQIIANPKNKSQFTISGMSLTD